MTTARQILLVRHPETQANAELRHVAQGDSAYSSLGVRQAKALPEAICSWEPDRIVCSPQRRALLPARGAAAGRRPLRIDRDLAEFDVGLAEGLTHEEGVARGLISEDDWYSPDAVPYVGGECVGDFAARCRAAWARLSAEGGRVAVVSHRGVIAVLIVEALGLPHERMWDYRLEPAHGALLTVRGGTAELESLDALPLLGDGGTMHSSR